jgi:heme oxygenase
MRDRTAGLHRQAERSGVVAQILQGGAEARSYALLLRNLLPAYRALERELLRHQRGPSQRGLAPAPLRRRKALETDLESLAGAAWRGLLVLPAGRRYAHRIAAAARADPALLAAHAYARYLGDLNGGQVLQRRLARAPGIGPQATNFHRFPGIADLAGFRLRYRRALERAAARARDRRALADEAALAFRLNIALSEAVARAARAAPA